MWLGAGQYFFVVWDVEMGHLVNIQKSLGGSVSLVGNHYFARNLVELLPELQCPRQIGACSLKFHTAQVLQQWRESMLTDKTGRMLDPTQWASLHPRHLQRQEEDRAIHL